MLIPADVGAPPVDRQRAVVALALLSLTAGFLHASVIDAHRGHGIAGHAFTALAIFQVAWAGLAILRPTRPVLALGAVANLTVVFGWVLSRTSGIARVNGFEDVEPIAFPDAVSTALEVLLVGGALFLLWTQAAERARPSRLSAAGLGLLSLAIAGVGVPAAAAGASSEHAHDQTAAGEHADHTNTEGAGAEAAVHAHGDEGSGDESVTPEQQARADQLLADTRSGLWQWADEEKTYAAGFRSINDGITGTEHLVNWNWINDDVVLDPDKPESLVYRVTEKGRVLEAAMYMAPAGTPDDEVPDIGGTLTQWHIHNNLCYSPEGMVDGAPQRSVIGLTAKDGSCAQGEALTPHAPMLHVWTVDKPCGPFSSLEGVGAGQAILEAPDPNVKPDCDQSAH